MNKENIERTFGIIKPEGIERKLESEIFERIHEKGLIVDKSIRTILNEYQFQTIYGHVQEKIPKIYPKMQEYLTSNPVWLLEIKGKNAVEVLLQVRGASNATDAKPGTIRGDYAKDQDYKMTREKGQIAYNVFHASDSKEDAKQMLEIFFHGGA